MLNFRLNITQIIKACCCCASLEALIVKSFVSKSEIGDESDDNESVNFRAFRFVAAVAENQCRHKQFKA